VDVITERTLSALRRKDGKPTLAEWDELASVAFLLRCSAFGRRLANHIGEHLGWARNSWRAARCSITTIRLMDIHGKPGTCEVVYSYAVCLRMSPVSGDWNRPQRRRRPRSDRKVEACATGELQCDHEPSPPAWRVTGGNVQHGAIPAWMTTSWSRCARTE